MDALQHYAVARARNGDWSVANAMELVARRADDKRICLIATACGITALGSTEDGSPTGECGECDGTGWVEATSARHNTMDVDCPWCDGTGQADDSADEERVTWQTLDGDPVPSHIFDSGTGLDTKSAHTILNSRQQLAEALYQLERLPRGPLWWWPEISEVA